MFADSWKDLKNSAHALFNFTLQKKKIKNQISPVQKETVFWGL